MTNNIKYVRFASTVFKFITVINALISLATLALNVFGSVLLAPDLGASRSTLSFAVNLGAFITIVIVAFILYTVARCLELFADIAERVEAIRRIQWDQMNGITRPQQ